MQHWPRRLQALHIRKLRAGLMVTRWGHLMLAVSSVVATSLWAGLVDAATLSRWRFSPENQQLELVLPNGITPRYFVLAQPARIVLDLPNTDVGALSGEQSFSGAVRQVRVAQFEPDLVRVVLEMNPDAVFAAGQAELTAVETLANGETRWVLRPLLRGEESTGAVAALPAPPVEMPVEMPVETAATPIPDAPMPPTEDTPLPALEPAPIPVELPVELSIEEASIPPTDAATVPLGQGADLLQTDPVFSPSTPLPGSSGSSSGFSIPGSPSTAPDDDFVFADSGIDIPVEFPSPAAPLTGISPSTTALFPSAATPSADATISVPALEENPIETAVVPLPDQMLMPPIETPSTPISVGMPATVPASQRLARGQGLRLRYPRTTALAVPSGQGWQEVLVVANSVSDPSGALLIPAGSQVVGRFEPQGRGFRFVAQAIAIGDQTFLLEGISEPLRSSANSLMQPNQVIDLELTRDWQPSL